MSLIARVCVTSSVTVFAGLRIPSLSVDMAIVPPNPKMLIFGVADLFNEGLFFFFMEELYYIYPIIAVPVLYNAE